MANILTLDEVRRAKIEKHNRNREELARRKLMAFAEFIDADYQRAKHLEFIQGKLEQVQRFIETGGKEGIGRLIVSLPPRHCLDGSTLVTLSSGQRIPISHVRVGDAVMSYAAHSFTPKKVIGVWKNGVQARVKVSLANGNFIIGTPNHRLLTYFDWKTIGDLSVSDVLSVPSKLPHRQVDDTISEDDAILAAVWIAEGSKRTKSFVITSGNKSVRAKIKSIAEKKNWLVRDNDRLNLRLTCDKPQSDWSPVAWMRRVGLAPFSVTSYTVRLPQWLLSANEKISASALAYLWASDGWFGRESRLAGYTTASINLAYDVQALLLNIGVQSRVKDKWVLYKGERRLYHDTLIQASSLAAFNEQVLVPEKPPLVAYTNFTEDFPPEWRRELLVKTHFHRSRWNNRIDKLGWTSSEKVRRSALLEENTNLLERVDGAVRWSQIVSIEKLEDGEVYDIEVENNHSFIANNIVSHNSKSSTVTMKWPLFMLGQHPDWRFILVSYNQEKANDFSRAIRDTIGHNEAYSLLFPDTILNTESAAVERWNLLGTPAGIPTVIAVGVEGPVVGRGGNCLVGSTVVQTTLGNMRIDTLVGLVDKPKVLSYNHALEKLEYKSVVATNTSKAVNLIEIATTSGRKIRSTPEHRFYNKESGYRNADSFVAGERFNTVVFKEEQDMCFVRNAEEGSRCALPDVLQCGQTYYSDSSVLQLQQGIREVEGGVRKVFTQRSQRFLLLTRMFRNASRNKKCEVMQNMRDAIVKQTSYVLFRDLPTISKASVSEDVSRVQKEFFSEIEQKTILWQSLCRHSTFYSDVRQRQFKIHTRKELHKRFSNDALACNGKRQFFLCSLLHTNCTCETSDWANKNKLGCTPHRRKYKKQHNAEPSNTLCTLSHVTPQIEEDTVSSVTRIQSVNESVYDLQIEDNNNFFANGILVHNCIILDDLVKNRADAESATLREAVRRYYAGTLRTRLEPNGAIIICNTRMHEDDIIGNLIDQQRLGGEMWEVINLPAICESDIDLLGRRRGEALWPERWDYKTLMGIKQGTTLGAGGSYEWESQYQGHPKPPEGSKISISDFQYADAAPEGLVWKRYWDLALSERAEASFTASCKGAFDADMNFWIADVTRDKDEWPRVEEKMKKTFETELKVEQGIEEKLHGLAIIGQFMKDARLIKSHFHGVKVDTNKLDRALPWISRLEAKKVFMVRGKWNDDFLDEARNFTGINDQWSDQIDSVSGVYQMLANPKWKKISFRHV